MNTAFTKSLLRSTTLAAGTLAALAAGGAAQAATVNGPYTFMSALSGSVANVQVCNISASAPMSFPNNDGGGVDRVAHNLTYANGTRVNPAVQDIIGGGLTGFGFVNTTSAPMPAAFAPNPTQPVFLTMWEVTGTNTIGAQLAQVQIPRAALIQTGGNCLRYVPNTAPAVSAGSNTNALGGAPVALAGAATDLDGDSLTYSWTQTAGPSVAITGANTLTPSFTPAVNNGPAIPYTFQLSVTDGIETRTSNVTVQVANNAPPVVNAGPDQNVAGGANVALAGSATDNENDPLTYAWTQTAGPGVTLANATSLTPSFSAPAKTALPQVLTFSLVANDGTSNSLADTIDVTVAGNLGPTANAGADRTVGGGANVQLDGGLSTDGDNDALTYTWVQTGGTAVTLTGANTRTPSFIAPAGGQSAQNLTFELVVSDGLTSSTADAIVITVNPNAPPVANAGPDQGPINSGATVTLNGTGSSDPDNNPLTYSWTQVSGPPVTLSSATAASPTFVAPNVTGTQNLVFQLVVNDGSADSPPDTVTIAVRAVGTITVIQRTVGADGSFTFTSDVNALAGTITTSGGTGQRSASLVPAGSHTLAAADARAAGYVVTAIACNDSDSVVNLANRSVAIALSPNENLVCTFTSTNTRDAALTAISNFLTARNAALLSNQPDLQRRLDRLTGADGSGGNAMAFGLPIPGSGRLPFSATLTNVGARASTSLGVMRAAAGDRSARPFDIWAEATFASLDYNGMEGNFSVIYTGADYRIGRNLLIGGLAQFDRYSPDGARGPGSASGHGWMAGPYLTARIAPNLYADVRAAWGKSDNTISPLGTYVDPFETSRALYSGSLIGQFDIGENTQFRPEIVVRHLQEKQKAYLDNFGVPIPGQTVSQGDLAFRPRLQHNFALSDGWTLRPFVAADGIYTYGLERQTVFSDSFRMRVEGGLDLISTGSFRAGAAAFHDGIGSTGFRSTGGRISVSFGF